MPSSDYICIDGDFIRNSEPRLFTENRAFRYNDALTENVHANATDTQFLELHIGRMTENMRILSMEVPLYFNAGNFKELITALLNKNRIFGGAHIRITVFRKAGNKLLPESNEVSFLIESDRLAQGQYVLNDKGLTIGISHYIRQTDELFRVHRAGLTTYMLSEIEARESGCDAMVLLNQAGRLTETSDSNLFLVGGKSLFTPAVEQGCIPGIMRRVVINCASQAGLKVNEQSSLTPAALYDAEEVFLTNAIQGIRWVGAYQQKRYYNKNARLLNGILNSLAFK